MADEEGEVKEKATTGKAECPHTLIQDEGDRRRCFVCGREWKKPMYDVLGNLDSVRDCYGRHDAKGMPGPEDCLSCPVHSSCIQLTVYCEGVTD